MKNTRLPLLAALAGLPLMLTSCPRPVPYEPPVQLTFTLPDDAPGNLKLAAVYYEASGDGKSLVRKVLTHGYPSGGSGTSKGTAFISLYKEQLATLASNARCTTPFTEGEAKGMTNVTVTPGDVNTCNVYFVAYRDGNNDNVPTREEERYITHDLYGYASKDFSYSITTQDGKSTESGTRTAGWSLVRHTVLQPSSAPGKYLVSMNSVPTADEAISIRLHEPTDFMISMSIGGQR